MLNKWTTVYSDEWAHNDTRRATAEFYADALSRCACGDRIAVLLINGRQILQDPTLPLPVSFSLLAGTVMAFHEHNNSRRPRHVNVKHQALAVDIWSQFAFGVHSIYESFSLAAPLASHN